MYESNDLLNELRALSTQQAQEFSEDIRKKILETVSVNGGHLSSNLGVVELTIALHRVFNSPKDKIIFDVGHQCYTHKLLTGRWDDFETLRKTNGISGFPKRSESIHDVFETGHASTSISAALGIARARDIAGDDYSVVAVIGDGALTGGMAYEALNDAVQTNTRLIIILNDNTMSISRNVGALSKYLTWLRVSGKYRRFKGQIRNFIEKIPHLGGRLSMTIKKLKNSLKALVVNDQFFTALGYTYFGPIDGHDIFAMEKVMREAVTDEFPVLIHVVTQKGKGYHPAEDQPERFHGAKPFIIKNGNAADKSKKPGMGNAACDALLSMAQRDDKICVVTAAMTLGTGFEAFAKAYPQRLFDVGIAEGHAVTMAAGLAAGGMRPFVAIYSTFLQRSYDQILHDVCLQKLPVTFLIDRAGLNPCDGETHHGIYDVSFLNLPNMTILAPRDRVELQSALTAARAADGPVAIRYPQECNEINGYREAFEFGTWETITGGSDAVIYSYGRMLHIALEVAARLPISCAVVNARSLKPIDEDMLIRHADKRLVVVLEDVIEHGSLSCEIKKFRSFHGHSGKLLSMNINTDFIPQHGDIEDLHVSCGIDGGSVERKIIYAWSNDMRNDISAAPSEHT